MAAEKLQGTVVEVSISPAGDELEVDAAAGATTLVVGDVSDFSEEGGILQLVIDQVAYDTDPVIVNLNYTTINDDANTITLAQPLPAPIPMDTPVYVFPRSEEKWAMVDIEGWDDVLLARLPHFLHADLTDEVRDEGIAVMVRLDGTEWVVDDIIGAGEELVFGDSFGAHVRVGQRGIHGYRVSEDGVGIEPTLIIDALRGNVSIIGEFGTAMPDEVGIFMFKARGSVFGQNRERPVLQFNVGATRDQPSIQADSVNLSGLEIYSGANTNERESSIRLDQGKISYFIEKNPDSGIGFWSIMDHWGIRLYANPDFSDAALVAHDDMLLKSKHRYGSNNAAGIVQSQPGGTGYDASFIAGMQGSGGNFQGMRVSLGTSVRIGSAGPLEVVSGDSAAYRPVVALDFTPMSDREAKQNLSAPELVGLDVVRQAPVYEWEYVSEPGERRVGVMANDLPDQLSTPLETEDGTTMKGLSLVQQVAILWQALQEIDVELDKVPGLRANTPERAQREEPTDGSA